MPAARTKSHYPQSSEAGPSSNKGASRHKHNSHRPDGAHKAKKTGSDDVPGVQKVKAGLRQTRRLLAKEKLPADVRIAAERKLKAQEAELQRAEAVRKERALAIRYHKVKFFERQKVLRKINQTKKRLTVVDLPKNEQKKLTADLYELRVNLHYINHYPKTEKYISLYPRESADSQSQPSASKTTSDTDTRRAEIRAGIKAQIDAGELSDKPEEETEHEKMRPQKGASTRKGSGAVSATSLKPSIGGDEFFETGDDEAEDEHIDDEDDSDSDSE